jgi:hypothetical protein
MRIALYASLLAAAAVASLRWPAGVDAGWGSDSAAILLIAGILTGPFLQAERREKAAT